MLSRVTFWYLVTCTNLAFFCGGLPFRFRKDPKKGHYYTESPISPWRRIYQWTHRLVNFSYIAFIGYRLTQVDKIPDEKRRLAAFLQLGYVFISYNLNLVYDLQTFMKGDVQPFFLTQYIKFFRGIQLKYINPWRIDNPQAPEQFIKCNTFLTVIFTIGNLIMCQYIKFMLKKPHTPHFFTSLVSDPETRSSFALKLPLILAQIWVWMNLWSNVWFYIFTNYVYNCGGIFLLRQLNPHLKDHVTSDSLRTKQDFIETLNAFRVLHAIYHNIFRSWYEPMQKSVITTIAVIAIYGVIKLSGPQSRIMIFSATTAILYLGSLYRKLGLLYDASVKMREARLYSPSSSKWMKKYLRSIPEFRVDVACYYFVKRTTVASIMYSIVNGAITLLMTF